MLILAVDTSGKNGSFALARFSDGVQNTLEIVPLEGGTFSAQLIPQIAATLEKHGLAKRDIDAFALAAGPGSFTGLRVGLAAIKALAEVLQKPIAAVSVLEALAISSGIPGQVIAALDAGRGELYCAHYDVAGWNATKVNQELVTEQELATFSHGVTIVTSDDKVADLVARNNLPVKQIERPKADFMARIGFEKIEAGETVSPDALDALYIRRTDAEIKLPK